MEEEKKNVKGKGAEIKQGPFQKFFSSLIVEDPETVHTYLFVNVIMPSIGKLFNDIIVKGANAFFYGINSQPPSGSGSEPVNYNALSSTVRVVGNSEMTKPYKDQEISQRYKFKQLGYTSEKQARDVLDQLRDDIKNYKMATLLQYYEYSDVDTSSTENNWGWRNLEYPRADVYFDQNSQLWVIKLPKLQRID